MKKTRVTSSTDVKSASDHALQSVTSETGSDSELDPEEAASGDALQVKLIYRPAVQVSRTNKIICTTGYSVVILGLAGYLIQLALFHVKYPMILNGPHFGGSIYVIYGLAGLDMIACAFGIWTCLKKTGPKSMIFVCIWLLLSCLLDACIVISLQFDKQAYKKEIDNDCAKQKNPSHCRKMYGVIDTFVICSCVFSLLKFILVFLCRINYPMVFNWLLNKQVLVHEDVLNQHLKSLTNIGAVGGGFFDPSDIERLAARGSIFGTTTTQLHGSGSKTILVTGEREGSMMSIRERGDQERRKSRRATMISLSPN